MHYSGDISYLFVNEKESCMFKGDKKNIKGKIILKFSVDYNAINKSDISDFHKYLMVKNNLK